MVLNIEIGICTYNKTVCAHYTITGEHQTANGTDPAPRNINIIPGDTSKTAKFDTLCKLAEHVEKAVKEFFLESGEAREYFNY